MSKPLKTDSINAILQPYEELLKDQAIIAVAVSGGGDSMGLAHILSRWCSKNNRQLHVLTVNHNLRPEAKEEAKQVEQWVNNWPSTVHYTLNWNHEDKPETRLQEEARNARYQLLEQHCVTHNIKCLFIAHHQDDQFETFIIRLTSGSGLKGLAAMPNCTETSMGVYKVRPLLAYSHDEILEYCRTHDLKWIEDPSNHNDDFKRVRVRKAASFLEQEGLSTKRIERLTHRLNRADRALEHYKYEALQNIIVEQQDDMLKLDFIPFQSLPEEIGLRVLQHCLVHLQGQNMPYPPNSAKLEQLYDDIIRPDNSFKGSTLYKCMIHLKDKGRVLQIKRETD